MQVFEKSLYCRLCETPWHLYDFNVTFITTHYWHVLNYFFFMHYRWFFDYLTINVSADALAPNCDRYNNDWKFRHILSVVLQLSTLLFDFGSVNGLLPDGTGHYMNQCLLIINEVQWPPEGNLERYTSVINWQNQFEYYFDNITYKSRRGQWVNGYEYIYAFSEQTTLFNITAVISRNITVI